MCSLHKHLASLVSDFACFIKWFANEGKPPWGTALERYVAHRIHRTVFICYTNNKIELTQINILELIVATRAELTILV
jgi:hypothetical protein